MLQPSCAPPDSLTFWVTTLLVEACLLGIAALALAPLGPRRWRSRGFGVLSLLGALLACAFAIWSLVLRARIVAILDMLESQYQADSTYCIIGGQHGGGPGRYQAWLHQTAQLIEPFQRAAIVTTSVTTAFLLLVATIALLLWRRRGSQLGRQLASGSATIPTPIPAAMDGDQPARGGVISLGRGRVWAMLVVFALIAGSAGVFALFHLRQTPARASASLPCSPTMTASDQQQLQALGITLTPTSATVPIDAQTALAASKRNLDPSALAKAPCVVTQLTQVQASSVTALPPGRIVWTIAYRTLGGGPHGPSATPTTAPRDLWIFIDAHTGQYLAGASVPEFLTS